jgi:hypothetical protein
MAKLGRICIISEFHVQTLLASLVGHRTAACSSQVRRGAKANSWGKACRSGRPRGAEAIVHEVCHDLVQIGVALAGPVGRIHYSILQIKYFGDT